MKNLFLLSAFIGLTSLCSAQEIGVRLGNNIGGTAAVDAVFGNKAGRIHANISFGNGVALEALCDVLYMPLGSKGLNWYAGVGAFAYIHDPFHLGASSELGLEYRFKGAPFALGMDWRPTLRIIESTDFYWDRAGVNFRYVF